MTNATIQPIVKKWLTRAEAAEYLGIAVGTLANRNSAGLPPYGKRGGNRVRYSIEELDRFANGETII